MKDEARKPDPELQAIIDRAVADIAACFVRDKTYVPKSRPEDTAEIERLRGEVRELQMQGIADGGQMQEAAEAAYARGRAEALEEAARVAAKVLGEGSPIQPVCVKYVAAIGDGIRALAGGDGT